MLLMLLHLQLISGLKMRHFLTRRYKLENNFNREALRVTLNVEI